MRSPCLTSISEFCRNFNYQSVTSITGFRFQFFSLLILFSSPYYIRSHTYLGIFLIYSRFMSSLRRISLFFKDKSFLFLLDQSFQLSQSIFFAAHEIEHQAKATSLMTIQICRNITQAKTQTDIETDTLTGAQKTKQKWIHPVMAWPAKKSINSLTMHLFNLIMK